MTKTCIFCGAELDHAHVNPWLTDSDSVAYECRLVGGAPECSLGREWYRRCTVERGGYSELRAEIEMLPVGERL